MKIAGMKLEGVPESILVLPYGDKTLVFKARALADLGEFDKLCPAPQPPFVTGKSNVKTPNYEDKEYKRRMAEIDEKRLAWMVIKSLEATEDLEWESVQLGNSLTWLGWRDEFKNAGFPPAVVNKIVNLVFDANYLNEDKLEEARKGFVAGQGSADGNTSGQNTEQPNTRSGLPVSE